MGLLKSPVWLLACVLLLLFLYQLYNDLEVDKEIEKGLPASAISIGHKLVPTSRRIFINTFQASKKIFETAVTDDSVAHHAQGNNVDRRADGRGSEVEMQHVHDSPVHGLHQRRHAATIERTQASM